MQHVRLSQNTHTWRANHCLSADQQQKTLGQVSESAQLSGERENKKSGGAQGWPPLSETK
jgi:hypothetical protein